MGIHKLVKELFWLKLYSNISLKGKNCVEFDISKDCMIQFFLQHI